MTQFEPELLIVQEITDVVSRCDEGQIDDMTDAILGAGRVFVGGAGRSGLMMKALAMRLMHLGISAHVVGETITPGIEHGDLLIVGTGSGQTRTTLSLLEAASARGARTAAITAHPAAPVAMAADIVLELRAPITSRGPWPPSVQPPGSLFEQSLLVICDGLVMRLMQRLGTTHDEMRARHTKLE
jgi:6-phospho-3-hexuloisomerase